MPPEELEEVRAWLLKASHDLEAAVYLSGLEDPLLDIVVYHCQQAMEKAVKGFLTLKASPFAKTHSLLPLVEQAAELDDGFEALLDHAEILSPFAWRFRYPGEVLDPDAEEAQKAVELADEALDFVLQRVPEEALPDIAPASVASSAEEPLEAEEVVAAEDPTPAKKPVASDLK
jgi:HEPN domain-containing protein